jgi:hypothetical protein
MALRRRSSKGSVALGKLGAQTIAVGHVHRLQLFELDQELLCGRWVMTMPLKLVNELALTGEMLLAGKHVPLGFGQVIAYELLIHDDGILSRRATPLD